jgi:hypothetical protein
VEPERQYSCGHEAVTDLVDISINLSDKIENDLGEMKVGDEKDFSIAVRVLCGYRPKNDCETATVGTSCPTTSATVHSGVPRGFRTRREPNRNLS